MSDGREERAALRAGRIVIRKGRVGEGEIDFSPVSGARGIELAARLTREAWSLGGQPLPAYRRSETPWRFVRASKP